jgi:hypothetical protein
MLKVDSGQHIYNLRTHCIGLYILQEISNFEAMSTPNKVVNFFKKLIAITSAGLTLPDDDHQLVYDCWRKIISTTLIAFIIISDFLICF